MSENETETPESVIRDIAKEFNIIADSVEDGSNFTHDRFLRFAFAEQEREKNDARDKKIAEYLRSKGVPEDVISGGFALK